MVTEDLIKRILKQEMVQIKDQIIHEILSIIYSNNEGNNYPEPQYDYSICSKQNDIHNQKDCNDAKLRSTNYNTKFMRNTKPALLYSSSTYLHKSKKSLGNINPNPQLNNSSLSIINQSNSLRNVLLDDETFAKELNDLPIRASSNNIYQQPKKTAGVNYFHYKNPNLNNTPLFNYSHYFNHGIKAKMKKIVDRAHVLDIKNIHKLNNLEDFQAIEDFDAKVFNEPCKESAIIKSNNLTHRQQYKKESLSFRDSNRNYYKKINKETIDENEKEKTRKRNESLSYDSINEMQLVLKETIDKLQSIELDMKQIEPRMNSKIEDLSLFINQMFFDNKLKIVPTTRGSFKKITNTKDTIVNYNKPIKKTEEDRDRGDPYHSVANAINHIEYRTDSIRNISQIEL